jgi:CheY-like chemotaxis protein
MAHILIIDDEPIYHRMIAHALEPLGHHVDTALNGLEGLKAARNLRPDLIITDVMMPDITGYEVTRRLRREPAFSNTPILVLTSQAEMQNRLEAFESGADDHMTKPFDKAELLALLRIDPALRVSSCCPGFAAPARRRSPLNRRAQPAGRDRLFQPGREPGFGVRRAVGRPDPADRPGADGRPNGADAEHDPSAYLGRPGRDQTG